ncbi:MAG TPA: hypothetical protein VJ455_06160 [Ignavibacteria bacterium]|nr:hypothetical protein [Ignavibacteria bacterium]
MKKYLFVSVVFLFLFDVNAQDKGFGLGIMVGEPTGLSAKGWLSGTSAIDAGLAWSFIDGGSFHIHADYLWHNFDLITPRVPFYIGVGGRLKAKNNKKITDDRIGVRVPVGLAIFISEPTSDVFIEIVPVLDLTPKTDVTFNGAVGFRYFFK